MDCLGYCVCYEFIYLFYLVLLSGGGYEEFFLGSIDAEEYRIAQLKAQEEERADNVRKAQAPAWLDGYCKLQEMGALKFKVKAKTNIRITLVTLITLITSVTKQS